MTSRFLKLLLAIVFVTIKYYFCDKNHSHMASIQKEIKQKIESSPKGSVIFPSTFAFLGSDEAIRQGLSRLVKDGKLIRLAQGIYLYPEIDKELGIIYPPIENIAEAIARRDKARIIPTGIQALNRLGLSAQIPLKALYMTDGTPRIIKIGNRTIDFQKTNPKILSIKNELLVLIITALKEVGKENITPEIALQIKKIINKNTKKDIFNELDKAPSWIIKLIKTLSENDLHNGMVDNRR
jgi:hypothetical protein